MCSETVLFDKRGSIGIISLNRPERLNALTFEMLTALTQRFADLCDDQETRVVILRGEGRGLCAGTDLSGGSAADALESIQAMYDRQVRANQSLALAIRHCPQPVIAAVRGPAVGGGFAMTLACDDRVAGQSVRFRASFVRIGLCGGDGGTSYFLPRLVGLSRAAHYLHTGRFIEAAEAERVGLVSRVVPDEELDSAAIALAEEMLMVSPFGHRLTKELLDFSVAAASMESAFGMENRSQLLALLTEDAKEGPRAFLEKRPPVWSGK